MFFDGKNTVAYKLISYKSFPLFCQGVKITMFFIALTFI